MKGRKSHLLFIRSFSLMLSFFVLVVMTAAQCRAEIAGEEAFADIVWQHAFSVEPGGGGMQGFCVTSDKIIFIQNASSLSTEPDKVFAYYLNDTDRYGNPVRQYSLANMRDDTDWEHGNDLTYNPVTDLVYVAFATDLTGDHMGCVGVMDPETLEMVDVIKLSDDYRVLGISYIRERDLYLVQTEAEGGFRFAFFDADFNLLQDQGIKSVLPGYSYQGMCVTEDYVLLPPCMEEETAESYLNVFTLENDSEAPVLTGVNDLGLDGYRRVEAEGIAEIGDGRYMMNVFAVNDAGEREYHFYIAEVPYYYNVSVISGAEGENCRVLKVLRGDSCEISLPETDELMLDGVSEDGAFVERDALEDPSSYTLNNVQSDHTVTLSMTSRYPAAVGGTDLAETDMGVSATVKAAKPQDVYGEIERSPFANAVDAVMERSSGIAEKSATAFAGMFVNGGRFTIVAGRAAARGFGRGVVAVSHGIYRHRRILAGTASAMLMLFGLFGGLVFRVRYIRRRNLAYAKVVRQKLKEEMDRVVRDPDPEEE
ncbi:MAG: hypothetical protein Q4A32_07740 [Lachnospiraceae bacterium]|nr:hypothetical protein [Lachnospiraceae bacterium]